MTAVHVDSPRTLDAALAALASAAPNTRLLAGGTDLMVEFETGRTTPDHVIDLWGIDALRGIADDAGGVRVGALTTCTDLLVSDLVAKRADILSVAARTIGATQIRNRATIGGNLGTASPAADLNPVLVALGATVRLRAATSTRVLPVNEFLCGYRATLRHPNELIESVWIPPRSGFERRAFRKVGTRRAQAISKVVLAAAATVENRAVTTVTAAAGSVAERTVSLPTLAQDLTGTIPDATAIDRAARRAAQSLQPIDDVRSTAEYRSQVLYRALRRMLGALFEPKRL